MTQQSRLLSRLPEKNFPSLDADRPDVISSLLVDQNEAFLCCERQNSKARAARASKTTFRTAGSAAAAARDPYDAGPDLATA
jgi:hypothetical protein